MSSLTWSGDLLTLEDWDALPEDESHRHLELAEGVLQMSPAPTVKHQLAQFGLMRQLDRGLDATLTVLGNVDVVLSDRFPPTVRQPDVLIATRESLTTFPKRLSAAHVLVAVEIISPGSRRVDRIMKVADYADAGITNYWIVDLDGPVSLDAFQRFDGRYEPVVQGATGPVRLESPVRLDLDLDALIPR